MPIPKLEIRSAVGEDLPRLHDVRLAAFAPVFASFRSILGDAIYDAAQAGDDGAQGALLDACFQPESVWRVYVAEVAGSVVGFVTFRIDDASRLGEIGLNAVHPDVAGRGIGTAMYDFALDAMTEEGVRVATVSTGGDPSHEAARRAYLKAGFTAAIPSLWMCCDLSERSAR